MTSSATAGASARRRFVADEAAMVAHAVRVGGILVVPVVVVAWLARGTAGGLTALGAVAFVIATFAVTGRSLQWAADRGPTTLLATALGGFFVRLVLYAIAIALLRPVEAIDGPVLALSAAAAIVVVLAAETRLALRHGELWWVRDRKDHA